MPSMTNLRLMTVTLLALTVAASPVQAKTNPAVRAIDRVIASVRNSSHDDWKHLRYKDTFSNIVDAAKQLASRASGASSAKEKNAVFEAAARLLGIALLRVDGHVAADERSQRDDWVSKTPLAADLHGKLVQARNDCLRLIRR